jgi:hypothetical protein
MENSMTSGIEPATFWFVVQYLNHSATAVPTVYKYGAENSGMELFSSPKRLAQEWGGGGTQDIKMKET